MAIQLRPEEKDIWTIVQAIIQLVQGRQNSVGDIELAAGPVLTVVPFVNCSKDCRVFLQEQTALAFTAAARVAPADIEQGQFTIRHGVVAAGAKFSFICVGG